MTSEKLKLKKPGEIRTRIAPSPTGFMHIGLARTALFNYLFAKKHEGVLVLRIEDTDRERSSLGSEKDIMESLQWLGINWDEGPYRQSQRLEIYKKYLENLLAEDKAYYCFCPEEELEAQKQYQMSQGLAPRYSGKCANLSREKVKQCLAEKKPCVIRFRVQDKKISFNDLIRDKLEFDTGLIGDIVVAKDINTPLYNFAVAVDDFEMKISHVIRGEEHISNTPKQILIQQALGFPQPVYAHLPLILGQDKTKLSKRHGAVSVLQFKKQGYLPEALVNFMAFLGWNPGGEREIYAMNSLIKEFSLDKVQKSGAVFNVKKLDFLNGFYIRQRSPEKIAGLCLPYLAEAGLEADLNLLQKVVSIYQERLKKISEIVELADFFFKQEIIYDKKLLGWNNMTNREIKKSLDKLDKILHKIKIEEWKKENLENILLAETGEDRGRLLWPLRAALTGKKASAGPFEIAEILGKEKTLQRIKEARKKL